MICEITILIAINFCNAKKKMCIHVHHNQSLENKMSQQSITDRTM